VEDAFVEHLPNLPCYRVPRVGRRFEDDHRRDPANSGERVLRTIRPDIST